MNYITDNFDTIHDSIVIAIVSIIVVFVVFKILIEKRWQKRQGIKTEGVVVQVVENITKGNYRNKFVDTITYFPIVQFTTHTWEKVTRQYDIDRSDYRIGDKVSVIFDKKNPDRFTIER